MSKNPHMPKKTRKVRTPRSDHRLRFAMDENTVVTSTFDTLYMTNINNPKITHPSHVEADVDRPRALHVEAMKKAVSKKADSGQTRVEIPARCEVPIIYGYWRSNIIPITHVSRHITDDIIGSADTKIIVRPYGHILNFGDNKNITIYNDKIVVCDVTPGGDHVRDTININGSGARTSVMDCCANGMFIVSTDTYGPNSAVSMVSDRLIPLFSSKNVFSLRVSPDMTKIASCSPWRHSIPELCVYALGSSTAHMKLVDRSADSQGGIYYNCHAWYDMNVIVAEYDNIIKLIDVRSMRVDRTIPTNMPVYNMRPVGRHIAVGGLRGTIVYIID